MKTFKQFLTEAKQSLNESFLTDEKEILEWLKKYDRNFNKNKYTIKNGVVDVVGDVSLWGYIGEKIKSIDVQFGEVNGKFNCSDNKLTSLKGCPTRVKGSFECGDNLLTSLEGGPKKVGWLYSCAGNQLTSLKGCPKEINGDFTCSENNLTTLEGGPKETNSDYDCSENKLTSLKGAPKKVGILWGGDFDCRKNPKLKSLDGLGDVDGKIRSDIKIKQNDPKLNDFYKTYNFDFYNPEFDDWEEMTLMIQYDNGYYWDDELNTTDKRFKTEKAAIKDYKDEMKKRGFETKGL